MTHQERIEFSTSRQKISPDAKIVKWLKRNSLELDIERFLDGVPTDFNYPNDYAHLYIPYVSYDVETYGYEGDDCYATHLTIEDREEICSVVGEEEQYGNIDYSDALEKEGVAQRLQAICERIILREIPHIVDDFNLQGVKGYLDIALGVPHGLKQYLPEYQEILISEFEKKYPDIIVRLYLYDGWKAFYDYSGFKAIYKYILFKLDDSQRDLMTSLHADFGIKSWEDEEEVVNVWPIPRHDIGDHGKHAEEWDILSDDTETDEYLKEIINQFSDSALYNDSFTSKNLIDFAECSNGFIGVAEVHAYNAENALKEALDIIIQDYRDVVEDVSDIRFIIYIGSNFECKEILLSTATHTIKKCLKRDFHDDIDIKVAIAHSDDLSGGGDLILYALS